MDKTQFINTLSTLRPSSTFLSLNEYTNNQGEVSDYSIVFHISYENALKKSILQLEAIQTTNDLDLQAKVELLGSFQMSLDKIEANAVEELEDGYMRFTDDEGKHVKGVKLHMDSDTLHIYGLVVHKKVFKGAEYPEKNQRPLTIAKDKLRHQLVVGKFRQFKITPDKVKSITVEKLNFEAPTE